MAHGNKLARFFRLSALWIWVWVLVGLAVALLVHEPTAVAGKTELHPHSFEPGAPMTTSTPTPMLPTATPFRPFPDAFEPNDNPAQVLARDPVVSYINTNHIMSNLSFYPQLSANKLLTETQSKGDVDWFFFYAKRHRDLGGSGGCYALEASANFGGSDPEMFVYAAPPPNTNDSLVNIMASNDDAYTLTRNSQLNLGFANDGLYWIKVWNRDPVPRGFGQTYNLTLLERLPTPTVSPTPYSPNVDSFEYNGDFDHASLISFQVKYSNLNFAPFRPVSNTVSDDDYFRLAVKQGVTYTCETLDLYPGVDTQLRLFDPDRQSIGYNDDASPEGRARGEFRSSLTWTPDFTGTVYLLVNEVTPPLANETSFRTYSLQCLVDMPLTPTATVVPAPSLTVTVPAPFTAMPIPSPTATTTGTPTTQATTPGDQQQDYKALPPKFSKGIDIQPAFISASGCPIAIAQKPIFLPMIFR